MKKVMIFGRPGSGKTQFAERLGTITEIPVFHLDRYFYSANWKEKPEQDFLKDLYGILKEELWILDGNCMHSLPLRLKHADTIIYFKMNRILCLYRILKRFVIRRLSAQAFPDRAEGCSEQLSWKLLIYTWNYHKRWDSLIEKYREEMSMKPWIFIQTCREMKTFLNRAQESSHRL
ncbi:MAG: hypothetical protein KGQ54_04310 [Verrucomicrobia bacterium]|nr:hypothetical protein [Verrucomicrobiota bacterium]